MRGSLCLAKDDGLVILQKFCCSPRINVLSPLRFYNSYLYVNIYKELEMYYYLWSVKRYVIIFHYLYER